MRSKIFAPAAALAAMTATASAQDSQCKGKLPELNVLVQAMPSISYLDQLLPEFNEKWGTEVKLSYLGENERRAKSRLDASTGAGVYQVYYVDEANLAEFATSKWIYPLSEVLNSSYEPDDFRPGLASVATREGVMYFAPITGGGDIMMYRKDLLEEAGLSAPKTLDELSAAVEKLNDPSNKMSGWAARGQRGFGSNVWRWTPFFRGMGGEWVVDGVPAFNSEAGVKATEIYMDLMEFSPVGSSTFTWSDVTEAFRGGQAAIIIESEVLGPWMEDKEKSSVVGKVGYAPVPEPLSSSGYAHGLAVSTKGAADECAKTIAGDFVGWATSSDMEMRRVKDGIFADIARTSTLKSEEYLSQANQEFVQAVIDSGPRTKFLVMASPAWPEIGDALGLALEQLFTKQATDVNATLDQAAFEAEDALMRAQ